MISISSLLASVGLASYTCAQARARDVKRQGDLTSLRNALEDLHSIYINTGMFGGLLLPSWRHWYPPASNSFHPIPGVGGLYVATAPFQLPKAIAWKPNAKPPPRPKLPAPLPSRPTMITGLEILNS